MQTTTVKSRSDVVSMEELKTINHGINDVWQLIKKYLPGADADNDDYWTALIRESGEIDKKYGGHALIRQFILAATNYIEQEARRHDTT